MQTTCELCSLPQRTPHTKTDHCPVIILSIQEHNPRVRFLTHLVRPSFALPTTLPRYHSPSLVQTHASWPLWKTNFQRVQALYGSDAYLETIRPRLVEFVRVPFREDRVCPVAIIPGGEVDGAQLQFGWSGTPRHTTIIWSVGN